MSPELEQIIKKLELEIKDNSVEETAEEKAWYDAIKRQIFELINRLDNDRIKGLINCLISAI